MFLDFLIQFLFASIFFLGIAGVGSFLIGVLKFKANNLFLYSGMAFFLSLCFYIILSIPFLKIFPDKILTLEIFSGVYFLISFVSIFLFYKSLSWRKIENFFKENCTVFLATFFVLVIFFLQIYHTALFDEWLHRPVVKYFVTNGDFPFINPYNPEQNFNSSYHYGLYIPASFIQLITSLSSSESLDVLKLSFAIASFFLIYGIVFQFSKKRAYSIFAGLIILMGGGLFFFFDMLSSGNYDIWDHSISFFRNPVLFLMAGITWINIILSVAFIWLMEQIFNKKALFDFNKIAVFLILLGGFYLISELFVVLVIILFIFSLILNFTRGEIKLKDSVWSMIILLVSLFPIIFFIDGTAGSLSFSNFKNVLAYRSFGNWGYPNSYEIMGKSSWFDYIKSYSLEFLILISIGWFFFKKANRKKTLEIFKKFPLTWLSLFICALVPFFFSTIYGDINLAKLRELWPLLLYLLFFYFISKLKIKRATLVLFASLFILSCLPICIVNLGIQWKNNDRYERIRCRENNLCYKQEEVNILREFEKNNPEKNKSILIDFEDESKLIDETNSKTIFVGNDITNESIEKSQAEYLFYSLNFQEKLTRISREVIWNNFEGYLAERKTAILRRRD